MRNDEQSINDKPLVIHGASLVNLKELINYKHKIPVLIPFDVYAKKKSRSITWEPWWKYLFVDSGAFSVSQGNASVNLKSYIRFIKINEEKINNYASLDVVGDGKTSLLNWRRMRKEGLFPIPVFHDGEPIDILKEYVDNCSYVGLGAVAFKSNKSRMIFFDRIFSMFPNRSKVGFHGFGVMQIPFLERYPWRSVDSSRISIVARCGAIFCPNHLGGDVSIAKKSSMKRKSRWYSNYNEEQLKIEFKNRNLSYEKACKSDKEGMIERIFFSLDFFDDHVKIPNEFNPKLRIISLFD